MKNILSALFRIMKEQQGAVNIVSFMEKPSREKFYLNLTMHSIDNSVCSAAVASVVSEREHK